MLWDKNDQTVYNKDLLENLLSPSGRLSFTLLNVRQQSLNFVLSFVMLYYFHLMLPWVFLHTILVILTIKRETLNAMFLKTVWMCKQAHLTWSNFKVLLWRMKMLLIFHPSSINTDPLCKALAHSHHYCLFTSRKLHALGHVWGLTWYQETDNMHPPKDSYPCSSRTGSPFLLS